MDSQLQAIIDARHHDPFSFLGQHQHQKKWIIRTFLPHASRVEVAGPAGWEPLERRHPAGLFELVRPEALNRPYRLRWEADAYLHESFDPYDFSPQISGLDLHLFAEGRLLEAYRTFGAQVQEREGVRGVRFAVWAPNAERVSVVGDFNRWDGRVHPMYAHGSSGVWELFIPGLEPGTRYKFEIRNRHSGAVFLKTDPYGSRFEHRPGTAAEVFSSHYDWQDAGWMQARAAWDWQTTPISCYEVHLGSWRRGEGGRTLSYRDIAGQLIPYVKKMGYTHIELMPVAEHPLDESWGYQVTGYFAPTSRHGSPDDFRDFVDRCHQAGIGVILDWVPGHFPKDAWALARFDGTALYEHEDPRLGEHQDWGTYIFNYGRNEVRSFLLANAHYWLSEFHIDGLRVDAVASMLYLDYSRKAGEWLPNRFGGRENLEAIDFLRDMNVFVHERHPGAVTIAEESTAWPMVSRPTYIGGLGFSMKWNMGWMNDTLRYMSQDPIHRQYHHNEITFSQIYAYNENFVLPLSHDEVVHGKRSLLDKMPGDAWQKFANLRLLFAYQYTHPGKKLNFMGNEIGQGTEWQVSGSVHWDLLSRHWHEGIQRLSRDLNHLYMREPALHEQDFSQQGFQWIDSNDAHHSVLTYLRRSTAGEILVVVLNFTPVPRPNYRIGVPQGGTYAVIFNSDSDHYAGSNAGNGGTLQADSQEWMGFSHSLRLDLPPLAGLILKPQQEG